MSTLRQIEANRRNAQKSTGPTSVTGKASSSMNALKTGLHAKSLVLPTENLAEFEQLVEEYYLRFHPTAPEVRALLDDLIYCEWSLRRLRVTECQMIQYQNEDKFRDPEKFPLGRSATSYSPAYSKLQYRMDSTRRAHARALQVLEQREAQAASTPAPAPTPPAEPAVLPSLTHSPQIASPQIGFVPPAPSPSAPTNEPTGLTPRGIMSVDGVLQPVPAGGRSFESFPGKR